MSTTQRTGLSTTRGLTAERIRATGQYRHMLLPVAVLVCAGYVLWRGAGRWSFDSR